MNYYIYAGSEHLFGCNKNYIILKKMPSAAQWNILHHPSTYGTKITGIQNFGHLCLGALYWYRPQLLSMVDTLGLATIFFTHSAADLQWPELANLICPDNPDSRSSLPTAVIENPAVSDWFFYCRVQEFIKAYYIGVLRVTYYWMRFEWQHRGSPHVRGLARLPNVQNVEQLLSSPDSIPVAVKEEVTKYADSLVFTINPAVLPDGSNVDSAPALKTDPHACNKMYKDVEDFEQDLADLVATCQRHTRCSAACCLCT